MMDGWAPPKFSTNERLNVANEIYKKLHSKYGEDLVTAVIEGSTAKGLDCPESDLEMRVVVQGVEGAWYPFFYKGMFVGISFSNLERLSSKANSIDCEWPVKGDTIFTCRILYDPKNIYGQLTKQARKTEESVDFNDLLREALADMYEHVYKVFILTESNTISAADESRQIAYWAAICVALKNKVRYLSGRTIYQESFQFESLPKNYEKDMLGLLSLNTNVQQLKENAGISGLHLFYGQKSMGLT